MSRPQPCPRARAHTATARTFSKALEPGTAGGRKAHCNVAHCKGKMPIALGKCASSFGWAVVAQPSPQRPMRSALWGLLRKQKAQAILRQHLRQHLAHQRRLCRDLRRKRGQLTTWSGCILERSGLREHGGPAAEAARATVYNQVLGFRELRGSLGLSKGSANLRMGVGLVVHVRCSCPSLQLATGDFMQLVNARDSRKLRASDLRSPHMHMRGTWGRRGPCKLQSGSSWAFDCPPNAPLGSGSVQSVRSVHARRALHTWQRLPAALHRLSAGSQRPPKPFI